MEYPTAETIIFNDDEFLLMLAAAGIDQWFGMGLGAEGKDYGDPGLMNRCLAGLYRKGLIDWNKGKARISDDARPVFRVLRDARTCILASRAEKPDLITGCYCADGVVVTIERGYTGADEIKITLMNADEWIEAVGQDGYFPHVMDAPDDGEDECVVTADIRVPQEKDLASADLVSVFTRYAAPSGLALAEMTIYDRGLYGVFEIKQDDKVMRDLFRKDLVRSVLHDWTGGKI